MGLIGRGWKLCEGWSRPVLIGRGLAHSTFVARIHCVTLSTQPCFLRRPGFGGGVGVVCSMPPGLCGGYVDSVVGGVGGGGTPGPIPNPEAKPSSADGTALVRVWESRSPPTFNSKRPPPFGGGLFFVSRTAAYAGVMSIADGSGDNRPRDNDRGSARGARQGSGGKRDRDDRPASGRGSSDRRGGAQGKVGSGWGSTRRDDERGRGSDRSRGSRDERSSERRGGTGGSGRSDGGSERRYGSSGPRPSAGERDDRGGRENRWGGSRTEGGQSYRSDDRRGGQSGSGWRDDRRAGGDRGDRRWNDRGDDRRRDDRQRRPTQGRPAGRRTHRRSTAPTVMRGGRIDRTVARSVTIAGVPEIGTAPATTAEAETERFGIPQGRRRLPRAGRLGSPIGRGRIPRRKERLGLLLLQPQ